ncbi:MAG: TonB-dependent receptor [Bacteroidetes bacterium]|nr:MAG: TonB-dependent receptor [Bacteroidota bacterium]
MMKYFMVLVMLLLFMVGGVNAQSLNGTVYEGMADEEKVLPGVNVYWSGSTIGAVTDASGRFSLPWQDAQRHDLVVSFVGYANDTLSVMEDEEDLVIVLTRNIELQEVQVVSREAGTSIRRFDPLTVQNISGAELHKAACCNLGESFETNASVDVHYSDAVTGAKQIQLLGLAGIYSQMMTENIPNMYGLATTYGLGYIPGSWMESIQVSKGAASVLDGYSSVTGQINTDTKNPAKGDKLFFNALVSTNSKHEANLTSAIRFNDRWSTALLLHAENTPTPHDGNKDGFADMPTVRQFNGMNRWKYFGRKGYMAQAGVKVIDEVRRGGEMAAFRGSAPIGDHPYGIGIDTRRVEAFFKTGYEVPSNPDLNMAFKSTVSWHEQKSWFGNNTYDATEKSLYANYIFKGVFTRDHKYALGVSFLYDSYRELFNDSLFLKKEVVPGAFFQYTFSREKWPVVIAGIRADRHNIHGLFFTPRLHIRHAFNKQNILRASVGKGSRTANIFAENSFLFASSRTIRVLEPLRMEEAWNYGVNWTHYHTLRAREMVVNMEFYRSVFTNQVVVDMDSDLHAVYLYNLKGRSFSNVFQVEARYELLEGMDLLAAYRWQDVRYTVDDELVEKPLTTRYKALFNLSYVTHMKKWQFDYTFVLNGDQRLPSTENNPEIYRRGERAPAYVLMNAQITKYFRYWEIYLGAENLTGYTQDDPIIAADDPYGAYFDASMVWGPLAGRKFYLGIRINPFY